MHNYRPTVSHVIQSGKKKGKSIEQLMFSDYNWLCYMSNLLKQKNAVNKNQFHKHIDWVLQRGETRKPKSLCPQCRKNPVVYFSVLGSRQYGYSMSSAYTCCFDQECQKKLCAQGIEKVPTLLPIKFSSIAKFKLKHDQKVVVQILKDCHRLSKRLTKDILFQFFVE